MVARCPEAQRQERGAGALGPFFAVSSVPGQRPLQGRFTAVVSEPLVASQVHPAFATPVTVNVADGVFLFTLALIRQVPSGSVVQEPLVAFHVPVTVAPLRGPAALLTTIVAVAVQLPLPDVAVADSPETHIVCVAGGSDPVSGAVVVAVAPAVSVTVSVTG